MPLDAKLKIHAQHKVNAFIPATVVPKNFDKHRIVENKEHVPLTVHAKKHKNTQTVVFVNISWTA